MEDLADVDVFEASFVPLSVLPGLAVRPPLTGHLRAPQARGAARTAVYLGSRRRPDRDGASPVSGTARQGAGE